MKLKTMPNQTCPELKPQLHCEHRHARDSSHSYLELQNAAVAGAWGALNMGHVYEVREARLLENTTHIFACIP